MVPSKLHLMREGTILLRIAILLLAFWPTSVLAGTLPPFKLRTLSGQILSWPADLPDAGAVLILAQDEAQQAEAATWLPFLASDVCQRGEALAYFIVPVLPEGLLIVRSVVESAIRRATNDPAMLDRTVPLFIDIARLQASMAIEASNAVQVVAVDGAGSVRASASGPYSPVAAEQLLTAGSDRPGLCASA